MAYEPKAQMVSDLKTMVGAADDQTAALTLALEVTGTKVLNEINQDVMPVMLEPIVVEIAADAYRLQQQATGDGSSGEILGTVSSVSDNGQSVSYRDSSYQAVLSAVSSALRDYTAQLARYRKTGW